MSWEEVFVLATGNVVVSLRAALEHLLDLSAFVHERGAHYLHESCISPLLQLLLYNLNPY